MLYEHDVLERIVKEAAKKDSKLSLNDRMGLVNDVFALSNANFQNISAALTLLDNLRQEEECELQCPSFVNYLQTPYFQILSGQASTTKLPT